MWFISAGERCPEVRGCHFMGWVISYSNEWEAYSNYFEEKARISRNWATAHILAFLFSARKLSWCQWVCHLAYANVLQ